MKNSRVQILLAEHERLRIKEETTMNAPEKIIQLYLTVVSISAGALILFASNQTDLDIFRLPLALMLIVILILGEITFLRLLGNDISVLDLTSRFQDIRNKFIEKDSSLDVVLRQPLVNNNTSYKSWSSVR